MPTLLNSFSEVKNALPKIKNCSVEWKQVTFPKDETQATFYLVASKNGARKYISEPLTYSEKQSINHFL